MDRDKKKLAAIAGVMAYLETETQGTEPTPNPRVNATPWSTWGRQQTMQYRDIAQRRLIKRNK